VNAVSIEIEQAEDGSLEPGHPSWLTDRAAHALEGVDDTTLDEIRMLRDDFARFMMPYKFAIDEVNTKISILREEFNQLHDYNPIENVSSRLKTPESIVEKVIRKGCDPSFDAIRASITDIAGVRVTCSFSSDVYRVFDLLTGQNDIRLIAVKDYIAQPKPNGYKSLHAILQVPVFLSAGPVEVFVEVQIRTVAMDFWASLEHKIYYKYDRDVPRELLAELKEAAETASRLDAKMERLHTEIRGSALNREPHPTLVPDDDMLQQLQQVRERFGDA
jgi:putative GTP pyrophosphokinase